MKTAIARALGTGGALCCLSLPAAAQDPDSDRETARASIKVLVTGSNIPTVERETALPIQVITREEIERANIQTAAQLVGTLSAMTSFGAFSEAQGFNRGDRGIATAGLRGLGQQSTLVLLNGRRVASYGQTTRGADLNSIPLAAIERVEVLKDGASAIYGSDAIAGVINFILRKEYRGTELSAQYTSPEHTGGYSKRLTAWAGAGVLGTEKLNAYVNVDYQEFGGIRAQDRAFAARRYIPEEDVIPLQRESLPANVATPLGLRNPTGDPADGYRSPSCAPPSSSSVAGNDYECRWLGGDSSFITNPSDRLHLVGSLRWQFDPDHEAFLYGTWARNRYSYTVEPMPVPSGFVLPPSSPYYPHAFAREFGIDGRPLDVFWRAVELGPQTNASTTEHWNVVAGMQGVVLGWNYNGAFNYSESDVEGSFQEGFFRRSALLPILNSGIVNPFGPNTQDVVDRMSSTKFDGVLRTGTTSLAAFDLVASKNVLTLPAGPMTLAAGLQLLHEKIAFASDDAVESGDVLGVARIPTLSGSRDSWASFAEVRMPLLESLEGNVAIRYDRYSDFGGTTNPNVSLRWQPAKQLMLRASAGTGFLVPPLVAPFTPPIFGGVTPRPHDDPARCPHTRSSQDCGRRFPTQGGGNPALHPMTSRQWSAGGVWEPTPGLSLGADYVSIRADDPFYFFTSQLIFAGCPDGLTGLTCHLIHRGPTDPGHPALPGPIVLVDQFPTNLGQKRVSAVDVTVKYVTPKLDWGRFSVNLTGTYNIEFLEQQVDGSFVDLVGRYSTSGGNPGVIPRWRHYLQVDWSHGPWSVTLVESYQTGTYDQYPGTGAQPRKIGDYDIWNLGFTYAGFRNWRLSAGVKNLFDRDPPFSNQDQNAQVGYDPSYADPHGRLYWVAVRFAFQ